MSSIASDFDRLPDPERVPPWEGGFPEGPGTLHVQHDLPSWVVEVPLDVMRPERLRLTAKERAEQMRAEERVTGRRLVDDARELAGAVLDRLVFGPIAMLAANLRLVLAAGALMIALALGFDRVMDGVLAPFGR